MALTQREISKRYRNRHPDRVKQQQRKHDKKRSKEHAKQNRERKWKLKHRVMSHYSKGIPQCRICDIKDIEVLTIEHDYGGGRRIAREHGIYGIQLLRYLIKKEFPDGYSVLCLNCQCKEAMRKGFCYGNKNNDDALEKYGFINKKQKKLVVNEIK